MRKKDLLKQLNNLQTKIKPDSKWLKSNRDILYSQIKAQVTDVRAKQSVWSVVFNNQVLKSVFKPVAGFAAIMLLILSSWIATVSATKNSLPGDFLYSLKLTTERVQVNLTVNDEKRTNLELEFAERRLDEVQKVSETPNDENKKNVDVALKKFQENMDNVKSNLAKLEKTDTPTAVKVANILDEKAKVYVNLLMQHKEDTPQLADNTAQAITASKSTGDKALSLIVKELQEGQPDLKSEDVAAKVTVKIGNSTKTINEQVAKIAEIKDNIAKEKAAKDTEAAKTEVATTAAKATDNQLASEPAKTTETTNTNTAETSAVVVPTDKQPATDEIIPKEEKIPTLEDIKDKPQEALNKLAEATKLLEKGEISAAFDKTKEVDAIISLIDKVIVANNQYLNTVSADNPVITPDPTDPLESAVDPDAKVEDVVPQSSENKGNFHI